MIFGEGGPIAYLMTMAGTTSATLTLERPTRRDFEDFEDVYLELGTDVDGQKVDSYQGVRFRGKYLWTSHAGNQDNMAAVQRLANWRGPDKYVRLMPHSDETALVVRCKVVGNPIRAVDGKIAAEEIAIELVGLDLLPQKPNPVYDLVNRVFGWGSISA